MFLSVKLGNLLDECFNVGANDAWAVIKKEEIKKFTSKNSKNVTRSLKIYEG